MVDRLGAHADAWDALVDLLPLPSPFLRSWWLAEVAVGEPRFVLVFDRDALIGGLALQRSVRAGVEVLQFLGTGPLEPDHLDLVAAPERVDDVVSSARAWLASGDRVIDLVGARPAAWVLDAVPGWGEVTALEVAPYVTLPTDQAAYLASRHGRMRSTITRTAKRLAKAGVTFGVVAGPGADPAEVERALTALRDLHDGRWGDESGFLASWDAFAAAVRSGVTAGEFRLHELVGPDGAVVAIEADFVVGGRMSFYQAGRLTDHELRGSGSVLRYDVIGSAIADGCTEFDLLRGGEEYKAEWADHRRGLIRIRRGVGPRGRALVAVALGNAAWQRARARRAASAAADGPPAPPPSGTPARIAFYTDAAQIGGAESVAKTLLAELDERFEVVVMGTTATVLDDIAAVRPSASTLVLPAIDDRRDVGAILAHRRVLRAMRPDVFHANLSEGSSCQYALLAALSIPGQRVVVTENSPMGVRSELSRRIKRWSAPRFDAHIGVGRRAAALVEADVGLPAGRVEVIPNAVPVIEHPARSTTPGDRSVVAVSRFDWVKGLDVLVRAVALVDPELGVKVTVFGDGPQRGDLEALIGELGVGDRVELVGWADDVRARLVDFDVFVLPSRLEGLPMSLLEAMHAGVAVVATDVGSVTEVIEDGRTGRVVPPDDPAALASALTDLLSDEDRRIEIAAAGHRVGLERFASSANVAAYAATYDRVMASPAHRRLGRAR